MRQHFLAVFRYMKNLADLADLPVLEDKCPTMNMDKVSH